MIKRNNKIKFIITFLIISFFGINVHAQEGDGSSNEKEERKYGNYLQILQSKKDAEKYREINKKLLSELMIIVGNFGSESEKNKYEELKTNYVNGVKDLYKRKFLESGEALKTNNTEIKKLYNAMTERYHDKAAELLSMCAEKIVDLELNISPASDESPAVIAARRKKVYENNHRLAIAYEQFNNGVEFERDNSYTLAIIHFRGAITQGVNILIDMAETDEEKQQVRDKYRVELKDVENQLSS